MSARFVPVHAVELPPLVLWNGTWFLTDPPKRVAYNLAYVCIGMSRMLLKMTEKLTKAEYHERAHKGGDELLGPIAELESQNGAEVITHLWAALNEANQTGGMVVCGSVSESNAHATAYAAGKQIAAEVSAGKPITIRVDDLDRLAGLLEQEHSRLSNTTNGNQAPDKLPRMQFDDATYTITLDGRAFKIEEARAYQIVRLLWDRQGLLTGREEIQKKIPRLRATNAVREAINKLPAGIRKHIPKEGRVGYRLTLPPDK